MANLNPRRWGCILRKVFCKSFVGCENIQIIIENHGSTLHLFQLWWNSSAVYMYMAPEMRREPERKMINRTPYPICYSGSFWEVQHNMDRIFTPGFSRSHPWTDQVKVGQINRSENDIKSFMRVTCQATKLCNFVFNVFARKFQWQIWTVYHVVLLSGKPSQTSAVGLMAKTFDPQAFVSGSYPNSA